MLDNASGSAAILDIAQQLKFALDADVLATPDYLIGVVDPAGVNLFTRAPGTPMPPQIFSPSKVGAAYGIEYPSAIGMNYLLLSADGTDAFSFMQAGIPASGLLTGQDCGKLATDVQLEGWRAPSRAPAPARTAAAST